MRILEDFRFFTGKPGPGSLSEALAKRLPVIVQRNPWTMAHELYNTEWIEELGAGLVIENFARKSTLRFAVCSYRRTTRTPERAPRPRTIGQSTKYRTCWSRFSTNHGKVRDTICPRNFSKEMCARLDGALLRLAIHRDQAELGTVPV